MDISAWLRSLDLERYEQAFRENAIDEASLPKLTVEDLRDLGVTAVGHRRILLDAIAALRAEISRDTSERSVEPDRSYSKATGAERRQLTVMFADLVGSSALSAKLDPEDLRDVIRAYHRCCTDLVEHNGGFVAKYMGDGILAYFGYPRAHEHDAECAVRAGLELVEAVPKLATMAGAPLQVRVGIATGLVVVGDLIGAGAAQEQAVVGETPNVAARLQAIAEPGTVAIAATTRRLIGSLFEYRDLGAIALKGFAENVPAWQVLGPSAAESRFEALRSTSTPLVGRDEEIDLVLRRWEQAKHGEGCVVLVSGEPGIGKSRIAQTVLARLSTEPHTRLRYFCSPHHQDTAYYPSIAQVERAAGFRRENTAEQRLAKLEAVLAQGTNELSEVVPLIADLLSIPTGDRYPPLNLTPQKQKEKTLHAQLAQVEGLAKRQPVLMVFEDAQWSDPTTRELLDLLIDRVPTLRVLVIITFRREFAPPWVGRPHVSLLSLIRLPPQQRAQMITNMIGGKALPKEIAEQIIDRTDGVPLFIEELTRTVVESGLVIDAGDRITLTGSVPSLEIPATLHASLLARLDRLAQARAVAQIGAAIGRHFSHELISAVAELPPQQVDDALAQLVSAELILRRGTPPVAEYFFKHALVQDAAYSTLLRGRRQQLHARIVQTIEMQFPDIAAAQLQLMAEHCAEAGLTEKAITYRLSAAQQAIARSAMAEAITHVQKGLDLLSALPDDTRRSRHELDLRITHGQAQIATQGYATTAVGETFERARQLCKQLGSPPQLVPVLYGQYVNHLVRGEMDLARNLSAEMRDLGQSQGDALLGLLGAMTGGATSFWMGDFEGGRANTERAFSLCDPLGRAAYARVATEDPRCTAQVYLSMCLTMVGLLDQAREHRDQAVTSARTHSHTLAFVLGHGFFVDWCVNAELELLTIVDELRSLADERGFVVWSAQAAMLKGRCLAALGQPEEGLPFIGEGLAFWRAMGAMMDRPLYLTISAEAHARARRFDEGLSQVREAIRVLEGTRARMVEAEAYRLQGEMLAAVGSQPEAEVCIQRALAVAREQSARIWELRAGATLARLWRDQGKRTEARDLLAPIYGWFTEGFDTPVLKEAAALLAELA
jgi:class 3 adenylate cyclase/predicted ATPase